MLSSLSPLLTLERVEQNESQNLPSTKRRPRFRRSPSGKIKTPTEFDRKVFQLLDHARFLSTDEICSLLEGERNRLYIQTRLTELYHDNWIDRPDAQAQLQKVKGTSSIILALGEKGAVHLGLPVKKNQRLHPDFLTHHHLIGTFFCRTYAACRDTPDLELESFEREPKGASVWIPEAHSTVAISPDARFVLRRGDEHALFFHEAETGKVAGRRKNFEQSSYWKKILYYQQLWRKYQRDYEQGRSPFNTFLVLTVIPQEKQEHMTYLMELCREADPKKKRGLGIFWFSFSELITKKNHLTDPVWVKPTPDPDDPGPYSIL